MRPRVHGRVELPGCVVCSDWRAWVSCRSFGDGLGSRSGACRACLPKDPCRKPPWSGRPGAQSWMGGIGCCWPRCPTQLPCAGRVEPITPLLCLSIMRKVILPPGSHVVDAQLPGHPSKPKTGVTCVRPRWLSFPMDPAARSFRAVAGSWEGSHAWLAPGQGGGEGGRLMRARGWACPVRCFPGGPLDRLHLPCATFRLSLLSSRRRFDFLSTVSRPVVTWRQARFVPEANPPLHAIYRRGGFLAEHSTALLGTGFALLVGVRLARRFLAAKQ